MSTSEIYDAVVVGGGPSGATSAHVLARHGKRVALIDRAGRIKPCGGAIPPRLIRDYGIPESLLCARISSARMVAPSERTVDMPIDGGFVGMVDREVFDEYLRWRADACGAERITGTYLRCTRDDSEGVTVHYKEKESGEELALRTRLVIGADGALSKVAKQEMEEPHPKYVFAYHEVLEAPEPGAAESYDGARCDVIYQGKVSPDFYGWVFPHGSKVSVGAGSAEQGFSIRQSVTDLRKASRMSRPLSQRLRGFMGIGAPSRRTSFTSASPLAFRRSVTDWRIEKPCSAL
ncbi:MAG: geranylgeranyl reductase family protein, partial [Myxococcota bacterium]